MDGDLISRGALLDFTHNQANGTIDANDIARFPAVWTMAIEWRAPEDPPKNYEPVLICREKEKGKYIVEEGCKDLGPWWRVYGTRVKTIINWARMPAPPIEDIVPIDGTNAFSTKERMNRIYGEYRG